MKWLEIQFWKVANGLIIRGYGANCEEIDVDTEIMWPRDTWTKEKPSELIRHSGRCGSCRAKEIIDWINRHIELIEY